MSLSIIGAGSGRTGSFSLKMAIEKLGLGPCYHCLDGPKKVVDYVFRRALDEQPIDWDWVFDGYNAAVDLPANLFYRSLAAHFPQAKLIMTIRDPDAWYESVKSIKNSLRTIAESDQNFADSNKEWDWYENEVKLTVAFGAEFVQINQLRDRDSVVAAYHRRNAAVRQSIPAERLLVFEVNQGWEPLCEFLQVPVPDVPFPHVNSRREFPSLVRRALREE